MSQITHVMTRAAAEVASMIAKESTFVSMSGMQSMLMVGITALLSRAHAIREITFISLFGNVSIPFAFVCISIGEMAITALSWRVHAILDRSIAKVSYQAPLG